MANEVFIPELIEAGIEAKLGDAIQLYNIAYRANLQNEQGGDVITVPKTQYTGDAQAVTAGTMIPISDFKQTVDKVDVVKYADGKNFTEEEINNAYGDVQAEAEAHLLASVTGGIENAMFTALKGIKPAMTHDAVEFNVEAVADALVKFGEDVHGEKYLLVNSADFAVLRHDKSFVATTNEKVDSVGEVFGCTVVVSDRVEAKTAFVVKPNAIGLYLKKDVDVRVQGEDANDTVLVTGRAHAATHLRDEKGAIKITITPATEG